MSNNNDPEFGFDKTAALSDPGPIAVAHVRCEEHHWVSTHQPDLPVYWIRQCSQCGRYDGSDLAEEIAKAAQGLREQGTSETEPVSGTTSYTGVIRGADEAETPLTEALNRIERLWDVIRANGDTNSRLMRERDEARAEVKRMQYDLILGTDGIEP